MPTPEQTLQVLPFWFTVPVLVFTWLLLLVNLSRWLYEPKDRDRIEAQRMKTFGITNIFMRTFVVLTILLIIDLVTVRLGYIEPLQVQAVKGALCFLGWVWLGYVAVRESIKGLKKVFTK